MTHYVMDYYFCTDLSSIEPVFASRRLSLMDKVCRRAVNSTVAEHNVRHIRPGCGVTFSTGKAEVDVSSPLRVQWLS